MPKAACDSDRRSGEQVPVVAFALVSTGCLATKHLCVLTSNVLTFIAVIKSFLTVMSVSGV